jgi:radical SAM enzyme (TIGR01210 family)
VECHPSLVNHRVHDFLTLLQDRGVMQLEVAMGLETVHPEVLRKLNKRMSLDQFARAADRLQALQIELRVFILVKPPFMSDETEALHWAKRSLDFAFDQRASVASLIPTRFGNGALEKLFESGEFAPPKLATLEDAFEYGLSLGRGRVFADLWNLEKFSDCPQCFEAKRQRLAEMNLTQKVLPPVTCKSCLAKPGAEGVGK